jgi:hypothetical protein
MASPNSSFTDIVTTTLQGYSGELADNITNHNALSSDQQEGQQADRDWTLHRPGARIRAELAPSVVFSGAETLDISPTETFTAAEYNYKQLAGNVSSMVWRKSRTAARRPFTTSSSRVSATSKSRSRTRWPPRSMRTAPASRRRRSAVLLARRGTNTNTVGGISAATPTRGGETTFTTSPPTRSRRLQRPSSTP